MRRIARMRVDCGLVVEVAHQCVARVGRDRTDAAVIEDLRGLAQQSHLRVHRVDDE